MYQLIDLKVGFSCNNKCLHCCAAGDDKNKNITLHKIRSLIDEFISIHGVIDITLTGGEITMRRDFVDIMGFIRSKKNIGLIREVHLQTNGRKLSDIMKLESTIGVVDYYLIALHGHTEYIHDKVTGVKGSFLETVSAFEKLRQKVAEDRIAVQTVISRYNYKFLKETYQFSHQCLGINEFNITFPHPMGNAFDIEITPTYKEVKPYVNSAMEYFFDNGLKPLPEALPLCIFDECFRAYVSDVESSRYISAVGYDQNGTLLDYLELSDAAHSKYSACKACSKERVCQGVWNEYIELYPDQATMPPIID